MSSYFLYAVTVLIWGTTWLAITFQVGQVSPAVSVCYRFALASGLLWLVCEIRRWPLRLPLGVHVRLATQGIFLFSLNYLFIYTSEQWLASGLVAVVFSGMVLFNALGSWLFLRQPPRLAVMVGGLLGVVGIGLVFWPQLSVTGEHWMWGLIAASLGAFSASVGNLVAAHPTLQVLPVWPRSVWSMAYGALFSAGVALVQDAAWQPSWSWGYGLSLLYLAVFGTVLAFGAYLTLLGRLGAARAAYVSVVVPLVALLCSSWFEHLSWSWPMVLGMGLCVLGNVLVLMPNPANWLSRRCLREKQVNC